MKRNNVPLALDRAAPVKATGPRRTMHQYYHSEHCVLCDAPAADGADLCAASFARPLMDQVVHDLIRRHPLRRVPRPAWRRRVCPSDAAAAARAEAPAADAALHAAKQGNYHRLIDEQARADDASLHALHGRARSRHPVRGDRLPRAVRAAEVRAAGPQREAAAGRRGAGAAVVRSVQAGVYVQASVPPSGRVHPPSNRAVRVPTNTYIA